jgi:aminoglycoside 2'-N-acetyltransferase I
VNGVQLVATADLSPSLLAEVQAVLADAFGHPLSTEDWDHALGGIHALAWADGDLVGHASLVARRLVHGGRALRTGYVEAVAVRLSHRRRGYAAAMMTELERLIGGGYDLGALCSSRQGHLIYIGRTWRLWDGPLWALTPHGVVRTPDEDGHVFVLPGSVPLDLGGPLTADWRDGDIW